MTFKSAYFKLTLFYVLIVMIISAGFSVSIYQLASNELNRSLSQQILILRNLPGRDQNQPIPDFEELRLEQLIESNGHLKITLVYFNLLILILSTIASYFSAKKTLEPIEKAMEAQNRFTADASHELRTPLAALRTEIEVNLRDKKLNLNKSKALLKSNLEEIEKLETLSGALLKLARSQDDAQKNFQKVSLEDAVCEAYEKVDKLAAKKKIKFENKLKDVSVLGDRASLVELFIILLDNAIKYSPEKSKIAIEIKKEKNLALVKIKDRGCGISTDDLPFIFDRFYRADSSRCKVKTDGYGLGLSIAKQIIDLHDGKISVRSEDSEGSEFIVKLFHAKL